MTITFDVPLIPVAKGRAKVGMIGKHARMYTPSRTVKAEQEFVALAAPYAPATPIDGPVDVCLVFVLPIPSSMPAWQSEAARRGEVWPAKKPDLDNLAKLVLDALNRSGRFWRDDAVVCELRVQKRYGDQPGTRVVISELRQCGSAAEWKARRSA